MSPARHTDWEDMNSDCPMPAHYNHHRAPYRPISEPGTPPPDFLGYQTPDSVLDTWYPPSDDDMSARHFHPEHTINPSRQPNYYPVAGIGYFSHQQYPTDRLRHASPTTSISSYAHSPQVQWMDYRTISDPNTGVFVDCNLPSPILHHNIHLDRPTIAPGTLQTNLDNSQFYDFHNPTSSHDDTLDYPHMRSYGGGLMSPDDDPIAPPHDHSSYMEHDDDVHMDTPSTPTESNDEDMSDWEATSKPKRDQRPSNVSRSITKGRKRSSPTGMSPAANEESNKRPYPCPLRPHGCTKTFTQKNEWKRHVKVQHVNADGWRCSLCFPPNAHIFNRWDLFKQHLDRTHAEAQSHPTLTPRTKQPVNSRTAPSASRDQLKPDWTSFRHDDKVKPHDPPTNLACVFCKDYAQHSFDDWLEHTGRHLATCAKKNKDAIDPSSYDDFWRSETVFRAWLLKEGFLEQRNNRFVLVDKKDKSKGSTAHGAKKARTSRGSSGSASGSGSTSTSAFDEDAVGDVEEEQ